MKPVILPLAILAVIASAVAARADVTLDGKPVGSAETGMILVRESDCRALALHKPGPDVIYKPGVDVNGGEVAPADLQPRLDLTERARTFGFAVTVDLDDQLGTGGEGQSRPFDGEGYLGYVELRDGVPYWNGAPLDTDGIEAVSAACRQVREENEKDR